MPSSFTAARFEPAGKRLYAIRGEAGDGFGYDIGFLGSGLRVHVREGFLTDGPSIPALVRWLVPKRARERAMKSAAVHDMLREDRRFTLLEGDAIFLMAMEAEGTPAFWREAFFRAVRTNGNRASRNPPP